jgi:hypothetical protein
MMAKTAPIFSKTLFWIENILFYFTYMVIYHLVLVIIVYLKLTINVARAASPKTKLPSVLVWIVIGPFYLIGCVFKDLYYYSKILCEYREEVNVFEEQQDEDKLQDKIFIYNEIIDTLRSVMNIFKYNYQRHILDKPDRGCMHCEQDLGNKDCEVCKDETPIPMEPIDKETDTLKGDGEDEIPLLKQKIDKFDLF